MKRKDIFNFKTFVDCGAPSLYNKLSRQEASKNRIIMGTKMSDRKFDDFTYTTKDEYTAYRDAYIEFIHEHKDKIDFYSNLDVINNPKLTLENQQIMEAAGLNPIPVWHLGGDVRYLDRYVKKYDYVAIGGLVPNPTTVLIPWLDKLFKEHLLDEEGYPKVKIHGFACTAVRLMARYPWYSVDSAACRKLGNFGIAILPDYSKSSPINHFQISSRKLKRNPAHDGMWPEMEKTNLYAGMTKELRAAFDMRAEKYGITVQELADNSILRVAWNYLLFAEILEHLVPKYPWKTIYKTGKPDVRIAKEGADEFMTFYFAGILSKSEEEAFWKGVAVENVEKMKGTLRSFFYKTNAEYVLSLKK